MKRVFKDNKIEVECSEGKKMEETVGVKKKSSKGRTLSAVPDALLGVLK